MSHGLSASCLPPPESPAYLAVPDARAVAWPEPGQSEEHPSYSPATLQILANMPSRTIGRCHPFPTLPRVPEHLGDLPRPPNPCSAPQDTALGPSSRSTVTARRGCGAAASARPCSSSAARPGPRCASTTWRPTPPAPRWKVRAPRLWGGSAGRCLHTGLGAGWPAVSHRAPCAPEKWRRLVKELLSLPPSQRSHVLLTMPLHLEEKRNLR